MLFSISTCVGTDERYYTLLLWRLVPFGIPTTVVPASRSHKDGVGRAGRVGCRSFRI